MKRSVVTRQKNKLIVINRGPRQSGRGSLVVQDIKKQFGKANIVGCGRVVFNIKGNKVIIPLL